MSNKINPYNFLKHSWGKSPEQKAKEKAYNHEYYLKNRNKWKQYNDLVRNKATAANEEHERNIASAQMRVSAQKDAYDKAKLDYEDAYKKYKDHLDSIPKVGSQRTREQNRILDDRMKVVNEAKKKLSGAAANYENAQNYLKSEVSARDKNNQRMKEAEEGYNKSLDAYNRYEGSEAGESERFKREMKGLKTRRDKNWEQYSYYESQAATPDVQKRINAGTWTREDYEKAHPGAVTAEKEALKAEKDMKKLMSQRRASAMARSAQASQENAKQKAEQFKANQTNEVIKANQQIAQSQQKANSIKNSMKKTQDRIAELSSYLKDMKDAGRTVKDTNARNIAEEIKKESNKLAEQRKQLDTINTGIKTMQNKIKSISKTI